VGDFFNGGLTQGDGANPRAAQLITVSSIRSEE
jgi:hypothetical protein